MADTAAEEAALVGAYTSQLAALKGLLADKHFRGRDLADKGECVWSLEGRRRVSAFLFFPPTTATNTSSPPTPADIHDAAAAAGGAHFAVSATHPLKKFVTADRLPADLAAHLAPVAAAPPPPPVVQPDPVLADTQAVPKVEAAAAPPADEAA